MTNEELAQLDRLLEKWIYEPEWDTTSDAWRNIVETRRQVAIERREISP